MRVAPGGIEKVSPCQWKASKRSSFPSQSPAAVGGHDLAPAEFLDRISRDDAAERLADQLAAEAMTDDGDIGCDRGAN